MDALESYTPWLIAGGVVIAVLAVIAGRLLYLLHRQHRAGAPLRGRDQARSNSLGVAMQEPQEAVTAHGVEALQGIRILASSYLEGQVGAPEAALRIAALQQHRDVSAACREQAAVFVEVAEQLAHIPSHGAWKALSRAERDAFRGEMEVLEVEYKARLQQAAKSLRLH